MKKVENMNKPYRILLVLFPLILSGCLPGKGQSSGSTQSTNPSTSGTSTDTTTTTGTTDTPDNSKIDSISLDVREIEVKVGKTSSTPIVKYVFNIPESEVTDDLKAVTR